MDSGKQKRKQARFFGFGDKEPDRDNKINDQLFPLFGLEIIDRLLY